MLVPPICKTYHLRGERTSKEICITIFSIISTICIQFAYSLGLHLSQYPSHTSHSLYLITLQRWKKALQEREQEIDRKKPSPLSTLHERLATPHIEW